MSGSRLSTLLLVLPMWTAMAGAAGRTDPALPGYCGITTWGGAKPSIEVQHGSADHHAERAYDQHTIQPIGSVSKTFVGLALAQMVERGALDLDAPVDPILGWAVRNPRHPQQPITLRQLATHTSSILDHEDDYQRAYVPATSAAPDLEDGGLEDFLRDYFLPQDRTLLQRRFGTSAPGLRYAYANIGAALAALVIERRSGQPFADYVQAHILTPLKMSDSGYPGFGTRPDPAQLATLYAHGKPLPAYRLLTYPDGGLRSSCHDLSRYAWAIVAAAQGDASALPAATVQRMLQPQWSKLPRGTPEALRNHGLFWEYKRSGAVGHSGGDPGLTALLSIDLSAKRARVLLTNTLIDDSAAARTAFLEVWKRLDVADP